MIDLFNPNVFQLIKSWKRISTKDLLGVEQLIVGKRIKIANMGESVIALGQ